MKHFLLGLIIVGIGFAIVYYAASLTETFGRSQWMERYLGSSTGGYMIFGTLVMIIGFMIMFGIIGPNSSNEVSSLSLE